MIDNHPKDSTKGKNEFQHEVFFSDLKKANTLILAIPDLVFIVNAFGDILFVKPGKDVSLAFPIEEVLGRNISDMPFSSELLSLFVSKIQICLKNRDDVVYTYSMHFGERKEYYEARNSFFDENHVLVIIRCRTDEELYKEKIIENEKKLLILNEKLSRRNNKYRLLNEQFQKNNESLVLRNSEIEDLLKKINHQEKILQQIIDNSPSPIFSFDKNMVITQVNPIFATTLGTSEEDLVGLDLKSIKDHSVLPALTATLSGVCGLFEGWYQPMNLRRPLYAYLKASPLYDINNPDEIIGGTGIISNLTDWKIASEKLQEKEENLFITLNSIADGVIVSDEKGMVKFLNPVAQRLTGWHINEAMGKPVDEVFTIFHSKTGDEAENPILNVLEKGKVIELEDHIILKSKSGDIYQISDSVAPIKDKEGNTVGVVLVFQDITMNYKMLQRIIVSESRQKAHFENSPLGIIMMNSEGKVIEINKQALKMLGSPSAEATKKINVVDFEPLKRAGFSLDYQNCLKNNASVEAERLYISNWGKEIYVKYYLTPIQLPEDNQIGVICSMLDVTEQKMAEKRELSYTSSLKLLSETALSFVELPESDDPFSIIGEKLSELTSIPFIILSYNEIEALFEVKMMSMGEDIEAALQSKNIDIRSVKFLMKDNKERNISRYFQDATDLMRDSFCSNLGEIGAELYDFINPAEVLIIDFIWESKTFGNATFFLPEKGAMKNIQVIETFINQASLLLQKRDSASELRRSKDLYLTSINAIADNFFITSPDTKIIFVNDTFKTSTSRYTGNIDVIGKNLFETFPFLPKEMLENYNEMLKSKITFNERYTIDVEGYIMHIEANSIPVVENDKVLYIITTFRDITRSVLYENEIKGLKEFNEQIVQNLNDGIAVINDDNEIIFTNPAFNSLLKYKPGKLNGKKWTDLILDFPFSDFILPINTFDNRNIFKTEAILQKQDGTKLNAIISVSSSGSDRNTNILLITDITERKIMEQDILSSKEKAEESDRLKTAFLANMSHEIRTPLNSIIGFSSLLQRKNLSPDKHNFYLRQINSSSEMLLRLIEDIIDISKIESGQLNIERSEFNVPELMSEINEYYRAEMVRSRKEENIELICENLSQELFIVNDYLRIKQVLSNLINNSLKFTSSGFVKFGVRISESNLLFYVADSGLGIRDEDRELMFKRFSRINKEQVKIHGGTGLGLAICKSIVEMLKGTIWYESEYNQGTTFYFKIPFEKISPNQQQSIHSNILQNYSIEGAEILIAEDDDINFMFINELLSEYKVNIIRANNGADAVEMYKSNKNISLILMDLQMPVMDGLQAIRIIRETDKKIPIIAQTAFAFASEKGASIKAGCDDYITKPIAQNDLIEKLHYYISRDKRMQI